MIKNFQEFLNENEKKDPMDCTFSGEYYTTLDKREIFPPKMIKELADELDGLEDNGRPLKIKFDKEAPMILMTAKKNKEFGEITYWYGWTDNDVWEGAYEEDVKLDNGGWTMGGQQADMSPEEFIGCLYNIDVLWESRAKQLIEFIGKLREKYHGAITGSDYHV